VIVERALDDAMFPLPSETVDDLLVLTHEQEGLQWDPQDRVLVTTWSRAEWYSDPKYVPGYSFSLYGETWVTAGEQVPEVCAGLTGDALSRRVEQLLGLPEGGGRDAFLQVWIDPEALFRPCADPDVTSPTCPVAAPLVPGDGDSVSWSCSGELSEHEAWLCDTWIARYSSSEVDQRYPWTSLGYTYDWADLEHPEGATELVAEGGSSVVFEALVPNEVYCNGE
jgi:hypothetical protein